MSKESMLNKDIKDIFKVEISAKSVLIVFVIILAIGLYGYFLLVPKYKEVKGTKEQIELADKKLVSYQDKIALIPMLEDNLREVSVELDEKGDNLNHNMEDGMFLVGLDKKMKEYNVTLLNFGISEPKYYEKFYAIPTTLKVIGDYRHVRELMYYLEEQKNITQLLDYSMEVAKEDSQQGENSNGANDSGSVSNTDNTDNANNSSNAGNIGDSNLPTVQLGKDTPIYYNENSKFYHLYKDCLRVDPLDPLIESTLGKNTGENKRDMCSDCEMKHKVDSMKLGIMGSLQNLVYPTANKKQEAKTKTTGEIEAEFKFIMYTKENPEKLLDIENPALWKTGKYNPFASTIK